MEEQVQEYNSTITYPTSWDFLALFPVHDTTQLPHFFNEVSSSCSSSSSTSTFPQTYSCQQSQAPLITPTCSFNWSEFHLKDPVFSADFQHQQEHDFDEILSPNTSNVSTMAIAQNDISSCNLTGGINGDWFLNRLVGHEAFGSIVNNGLEPNINATDHAVYSSSASSFVDDILDKDREMHSQNLTTNLEVMGRIMEDQLEQYGIESYKLAKDDRVIAQGKKETNQGVGVWETHPTNQIERRNQKGGTKITPMATVLQRSSVSFRRQGSSGHVWDNLLIDQKKADRWSERLPAKAKRYPSAITILTKDEAKNSLKRRLLTIGVPTTLQRLLKKKTRMKGGVS
ncbi:unnamed protein product [Dovyalis caffra]|uniref:Uncharacterized protein n=1 Tax=Dovyalis caffra TaxID=77055 RepID=A0AAV1RSX9_9ROSI|nr:unnamed protein product [Dovyalis caffra]